MGTTSSQPVDHFQKISKEVRNIQVQNEELRKKQIELKEQYNQRRCKQAANKIVGALNDKNSKLHDMVDQKIFDLAIKKTQKIDFNFERTLIPEELIEYFNIVLKCSDPFNRETVPSLSKHLQIVPWKSNAHETYDDLSFVYDPIEKE